MSTVDAPAAAPIRFELAGPRDDAALRALLERTPQEGPVRMAFLREPSFFAVPEIRDPHSQVIVARDGDRVVGVAARSVHRARVNGVVRNVGHLSDLRLDPDVRGGTLLAGGFRFLRELDRDGRADLYTTVIAEGNRPALESLAAGRAGLPCYVLVTRLLMPAVRVRRRRPPPTEGIARGSRELMPRILTKLNENPLQFAPVFEAEDFERMRGFSAEDFFVCFRGARVAGVMGLWDQRSFRQARVAGYRPILRLLRPLINAVRRPALPDPGTEVNFVHVAFCSTDDDDAYRSLMRAVYHEAGRRGADHLIAGLDERDRGRAAVLDEYGSEKYSGRLYTVSFGEPPALDGRPACVETALL